ncbi:NUDIX domain-containing protein [Kribbella sp.]|uniref:NUDIX domain-containing protein n=1 Tax=Kribbella sp. TaxID=1871183 RepID=UPI002D3A1578|nr:NUDIX domain-containing protein [Kribbella sp.]HZX08067.1 NUDIX domain-containing protein [Kribbella sp.]
MSYEQTYAGNLRRNVGNQRLITPGPRAVILNNTGAVLLVRRSDDDTWVMPAGGLELGESIWDALVREVHEETGLVVEAATPIALYTGPQYWFTNAYGGEHQMFAVVFRVDRWSGSLLAETDETRDARFFAREDLPPLRDVYQETLADLDAFDGTLILK